MTKSRDEAALDLKRVLDLMEGLHARLIKESEKADVQWDYLRLQKEASVIKVLIIDKVRANLTKELVELEKESEEWLEKLND